MHTWLKPTQSRMGRFLSTLVLVIVLVFLVETTGVEPVVPFGRRIYSPLGLPIFLHLHKHKSNTNRAVDISGALSRCAKSLTQTFKLMCLNLEEPRGIEPRFLGWKPNVLTDRRWLHKFVFVFICKHTRWDWTIYLKRSLLGAAATYARLVLCPECVHK